MVTVAIASINTNHFTELAIRTAVRRAGRDVSVIVGDGGSTDGTLKMLNRLSPRLVDKVELQPDGKSHAEWLDHWVATVEEEFVVFVESDVVLLRDGWLVRLLEQQERDNATIVAG